MKVMHPRKKLVHFNVQIMSLSTNWVQTKDYKIGICCFSGIKSGWLSIRKMSTSGASDKHQWTSTIKI